MKKIMISSVLALTACFTMVSQVSAAPHVAKPHAVQIQHQKASVKFDNQHKHVKKKVIAPQHKSKRLAAAQQVKGKYQSTTIHRNRAW